MDSVAHRVVVVVVELGCLVFFPCTLSSIHSSAQHKGYNENGAEGGGEMVLMRGPGDNLGSRLCSAE